MDLLGQLRALGWYLNEIGLKKVLPPNNNKCNDVNEIIKLCLDIDFREIAEGALSTRRGDTLKGPVVLQLQWSRNIAASKISETSSAPRMLCLELSDGQTSIRALEVEKVPALDLNLPPGTKIRFKAEQILFMGGYLLLKNQELQVLGGHVAALEEKWEVTKSMQLYAKNGRRASGTTGPPPWVAFGKNLAAVTENHGLSQDRNFKSLQIATEKEKENKDNEEFNTMRNEAIAEAAKAGTKKSFGGGGQQILDYNIKKILDKGYSEEEARQFLRSTNNNLERALYNLKRRQESKQNVNGQKPTSNASAPNRDTGMKRGGGSKTIDEAIPTKPVGNVSLFDFLTDKLPANAQKPTTGNDSQKNSHATAKQPTTSQFQTQSHHNNQETKPTITSSSQGSSQLTNRSSEPRTGRYGENRQQSSRNPKTHDTANDSNKRERAAGAGGNSSVGGNNGPSGSNYNNRPNGRGNRNNYDNSEINNRRGGDNERNSRKPPLSLSNNNNNNQNIEVNTNTQSNSGPRSRGGDNQHNRSNVHRTLQHHQQPQQEQRQQQQNRNHQYTNAPPQKQNYGPRSQRSHQPTSLPASNNANNMNMTTLSGGGGNTVIGGATPATNTTTILPNGFAYDPSKIIGFQSKEANEYAMNLMRSQGKAMAAEVIIPHNQPLPSQQKSLQPQEPPPPPIQFIPQPAPMTAPPMATALPLPIAAMPPMAPQPHHFGMATGLPSDAWNWKIGDLCMAKYWEDGQYYEAEITGICDKTCVVYYIGYNNHEEVLKADLLPITDANHRPINNYNLQQAMQVAPPPQMHQQPPRTAMRYYVPPHKRDH